MVPSARLELALQKGTDFKSIVFVINRTTATFFFFISYTAYHIVDVVVDALYTIFLGFLGRRIKHKVLCVYLFCYITS